MISAQRNDIGRGLMTRAIWKRSCINLFITYFARADNMLLPFTWGQITCYYPRKMLLPRRQITRRKLFFYYTCKFGIISIKYVIISVIKRQTWYNILSLISKIMLYWHHFEECQIIILLLIYFTWTGLLITSQSSIVYTGICMYVCVCVYKINCFNFKIFNCRVYDLDVNYSNTGLVSWYLLWQVIVLLEWYSYEVIIQSNLLKTVSWIPEWNWIYPTELTNIL